MKRAVAFCFLLACCGVLLGDSSKPRPLSRNPAPLLEDLVRLTKAGSSDVTVLAYAKAHRLALPPELSDSDLRWLRDSGVSELVVRYMAAIDVRASGESAQQDVAYGSSEDADQPRAAYSYSESDSDSDRGGYPERYAGSYADNYSNIYADSYSYSDAYPGYDYYPSYGYGYYPYPLFFVDRDGFFRRFHGRDDRFDGHRGFERGRGSRGHRGVVVGHGGSRDAWRERGFVGRRGSSVVVGPRGSGRPAFARGGLRPGSSRGFGAPRGSVSGRGGFGHRGFSGGPHSGGGFSRSPRAAAGSPGGRGRR